jgi:hypothetical protein
MLELQTKEEGMRALSYSKFDPLVKPEAEVFTVGTVEYVGAIIALILIIVPLWRICKRAGFNGALSLLAIIPWFGVVVVGAILSFSNWRTKTNDIKVQ